MPARQVPATDVPPELAAGLAALRSRLEIPAAFSPEVLKAAEAAAASPRLPDPDRTDLELITIDPEGSRDLDQALHIGRDGMGYVISYAIADVAAFVAAGDPIDVEAASRGVTLYAPDGRTPLHPPVLSEGAASLLPGAVEPGGAELGEVRPALLWTLRVDGRAELQHAEVVRARVRSCDQLSYEQAQAEIDGGAARQTLALLAEVGPLREQRERERGGVSLNLPEQETRTGPDGWSLAYRTPQPIEGWNAQISLLTGMAAAQLMITGQVGILRTVPPADSGSLRRLRQVAKALHIRWPTEWAYPEFVRNLDPATPADAAMMNACTSLFRGAGYVAFHGEVPEITGHAALATDYAHVTAPLRRRVDRYAGEICLALCAAEPVPDWVLSALDSLPVEMQAADQRAKKYERAIVDLIEAFMMGGRTGETFTGTVVDVDADRQRGTVMLQEPAVEARVVGTDLPLGHEVSVRVSAIDDESGVVTFEVV
jgi:exoribonuclease R